MTLPEGWLKRQGEAIKTEVKTWSQTKQEVLIKSNVQTVPLDCQGTKK